MAFTKEQKLPMTCTREVPSMFALILHWLINECTPEIVSRYIQLKRWCDHPQSYCNILINVMFDILLLLANRYWSCDGSSYNRGK